MLTFSIVAAVRTSGPVGVAAGDRVGVAVEVAALPGGSPPLVANATPVAAAAARTAAAASQGRSRRRVARRVTGVASAHGAPPPDPRAP
ncbi:hypothetical protein OJ962_34155, partial [Solirubrobacter sp. CPCC 204708]